MGDEKGLIDGPVGPSEPVELPEVLKSLVVDDALANEAMERLLVGAKTRTPAAWKKAWALLAARHLTIEALDSIMASIVTEAVEGESPKSRMQAQRMVLELVDKLSADDIAAAKGQPIAIQINFNEKPKDYLVNTDR